MFKILIISVITFMLVIITFLIFMSFMNVDIKTNSVSIEKFVDQSPTITGGGIMNNEKNYCIFTSDGSITFNTNTICEVLIVGGGGGGARNDDWEGGGGGGGGGVGYGSITFNGTYNIIIGSGGAGGGTGNRTENGKNGGNTSIIGGSINETAYGGGGGGWRPGLNGGSGGGGSGHAGYWFGGNHTRGFSSSSIYDANITYYGNHGGFGYNQSGGGGGGGAGSPGLATGVQNYSAGNGGNGKEISITGEKKYYGGGGGGATGCQGGCSKVGGTIRGKGGLGGGGDGGDRNNPQNGIVNTGGGGGGCSLNIGGKGGSGIVIIKYNNISKFNTFITDTTNLFISKEPWGMYFAEDFDGQKLIDRAKNKKDATTTGTIINASGKGNGASGNISYIYGGTKDTISWPSGSIPEQFTILSLTRWTGGSRQRILSSSAGNWLHGHWGGRRGICYYEGWKKGDPSLGNIDDWLCCISKNSSSTPNNILIDGIPYGTEGGGPGGGGYKLGINNNPWADPNRGSGEVSHWALSCVIIWDRHLEDYEMQLLNRLIDVYKKTGKPIIDMITNFNNNDTENEDIVTLSINEQFNINNSSYIYNRIYDSSLDDDDIVKSVSKNDKIIDIKDYLKIPHTSFSDNRYIDGKFKEVGGESITIVFEVPFILKKIMFYGIERKTAPASWDIIIGGSTTISQKATLLDYDAFSGKSNNTCIKFLIDNIISSNTYKFVFKEVFGGTKLDFKKMILFEGVTSLDESTASSSIMESTKK